MVASSSTVDESGAIAGRHLALLVFMNLIWGLNLIASKIGVGQFPPIFFTALRFGFSIGWKVTVLTEVFSSNAGIGFEMRVASQLFRMDEFWAWALSFFVFALFLEKALLQRYERKFFRWREEVTR